jgi:L-rhamnose isomerase
MKTTAYPTASESQVQQAYGLARERYAALGVDAEAAMKVLAAKAVSMHCWQGDDVGGFEVNESGLTGGIMATGNHPGKARTPDELRADAEQAMRLIPGPLRFNLHAIYLESGGTFVERDRIGVEHFQGWIDWAKAKGVGLDFNPTFFSHAKSASGLTLSHADDGIRAFWIEHGRRCREIAAGMAAALDDTVVVNFWTPDGMKDLPADRWSPRRRLAEAYDAIFATPGDSRVKDAVEGKLFGIGSEEYVVGSSEFYLGYALSRGKLLCLDMGHYHPTETIHDKLSAVLAFMPEALIHVSRPIRWDSDHVVIMNEDLLSLARELVRGDALGRVYLATDFFDASINRIGAWTIGIRALQKALLFALLEPVATLRQLEAEGRGAEKLALAEESRSLPHGAVWDYYCLSQGVPVGSAWLNELTAYERTVLAKRG